MRLRFEFLTCEAGLCFCQNRPAAVQSVLILKYWTIRLEIASVSRRVGYEGSLLLLAYMLSFRSPTPSLRGAKRVSPTGLFFQLPHLGGKNSQTYRPPIFAVCQVSVAVGQNQWYHVGVGAPPILVYFSGDRDVQWGYGILTHGHVFTHLGSGLKCSLVTSLLRQGWELRRRP